MTPHKSESPEAATSGDSEPTLTKKIGDSIMTHPPATECRYCTVPVDGPGDICTFCKDYTPPPTPEVDAQLAAAHVEARQAIDDLTNALDAMPGNAPLTAVIDVVSARAHLRAAMRLIDKAATTITATEAVTR